MIQIKHRWSQAILLSVSAGNLRDANLHSANLREADLCGADLCGANLCGANLCGADLPDYALVPEEGSFIAFKQLQHHVIAKLEIPAGARRTSSLVGRKCRAEFAKVIELSGKAETGYSHHDPTFLYRVGEEVRPDRFDDDIRVECACGIHFFITRKEAERF